MDWNRLDRQQSLGILEQISSAADPDLFSKHASEASFKPLPFYQDFMIYRVTNYATMPSFSLDFLSDGESFHLLDGTSKAFHIVNAKGSLYLTETNLVDYVEFYLEHLNADDGDIHMIRDCDNAPFWEALDYSAQQDFRNRFEPPKIVLDENNGHFIVFVDLYYDGTLLKSAVTVTNMGEIDINPREMMMTSGKVSSVEGFHG
jgi:hypothetical protein